MVNKGGLKIAQNAFRLKPLMVGWIESSWTFKSFFTLKNEDNTFTNDSKNRNYFQLGQDSLQHRRGPTHKRTKFKVQPVS